MTESELEENGSIKNYFYQDGSASYTTGTTGTKTSQNFLGTNGSVIATARYGENDISYYLYNKDIQGSTESILDETGAFAAEYSYDEFGITEMNGSYTFDNEICYTGGIYDWASGQYYLNARYYDPELGRFLSEDTYRGEVGEPGSWHLYLYCANNPVNYVDPSGHYQEFAALYYTLSNFEKQGLTAKEKEVLKKVPSQYCHFHRNENNGGLPSSQSKAIEKKWIKKPWYAALAHQFNKKKKMVRSQRGVIVTTYPRNVKYVKGNKEVIFYWDGTKNDTAEDRGSYNYSTGDNHWLKDVVPWIAWGNSMSGCNIGNDRTTTTQRRACIPNSLVGDQGIAIRLLKEFGMYGTVRGTSW